MEFIDKAFARRLEAAEINAAAEPISGGHMIFAGVGSLIGRAVGMGFAGPVSTADLDRLEEFYRSRGAPSQLDLCPLSDATLLELVKEREYGLL